MAAADSGSVYEPHPMLSYEWDPDTSAQMRKTHSSNGKSFDLGPHPADPHPGSTLNGIPTLGNGKAAHGPNARSEQVPAHEIWVYAGQTGQVEFFPRRLTILTDPTVPEHRLSGAFPLRFHSGLVKWQSVTLSIKANH